MSYARFSNSDVYVFLGMGGALHCQDCSMGGDKMFTTTASMLDHLGEHLAAGHNVPSEVMDKLRADRHLNDPWMASMQRGRP